MAPKEETDGLFLSYTVVQGTPSVCDALAKSRNEFSQVPQSHKVVLRRLPLKQEPKLNLLYLGLCPFQRVVRDLLPFTPGRQTAIDSDQS